MTSRPRPLAGPAGRPSPAPLAARPRFRVAVELNAGFSVLIALGLTLALDAPPARSSPPEAPAIAAPPSTSRSASTPEKAEEAAPIEEPLASPGDPAWQPLRFRSIEQATDYAVEPGPGDRPAYHATSRCSASAMLLALPEDFDLARTPRLAWRWRVTQGLAGEDERKRAGDDFAARVYVLFPFDAERASRWRRFEHGLGERLFGTAPPGETLTYVWASREPVGATWTSAIRDEARLVVLETNSDTHSGEWREAIVDLAADARRIFDPAPRLAPYALGLMTDADDTCREASAGFADFRLLGPAR